MKSSKSFYKVIFKCGDPMGDDVGSRAEARRSVNARYPNAVTNFGMEKWEEDNNRSVQITTFWKNEIDKNLDQSEGKESRAVAWLHKICYK